MSDEQLEVVITSFWENVDGGYCGNCFWDAVTCLIKGLPEKEEQITAIGRRITDE
jgi:hypothetical protein